VAGVVFISLAVVASWRLFFTDFPQVLAKAPTVAKYLSQMERQLAMRPVAPCPDISNE